MPPPLAGNWFTSVHRVFHNEKVWNESPRRGSAHGKKVPGGGVSAQTAAGVVLSLVQSLRSRWKLPLNDRHML